MVYEIIREVCCRVSLLAFRSKEVPSTIPPQLSFIALSLIALSTSSASPLSFPLLLSSNDPSVTSRTDFRHHSCQGVNVGSQKLLLGARAQHRVDL
jgi:hypothetical protein